MKLSKLAKPEEPVTFKQHVFNQKYRFDLGYQMLALVNFGLLLLALSDKLKKFFHIESTHVFFVVAIGGGFAVVWIFGYVLDKFVQYEQSYSIEQTKRNPRWWTMMNEILEIKRICGDIESHYPTRQKNEHRNQDQ